MVHDDAEALLANHGQVLADSVLEAVDEVVERLVALGAFYQGSEEVTRTEFQRFVANFEPIPGIGGVGFMPIVDAADLEAFEAQVAETIPGYTVFELDDDGVRVPVRSRRHYMPVLWFEPGDAFDHPHGFDSGSEPRRRAALAQAQITREAAATPFLRLISEQEPDGFLVYWPVIDPDTDQVVGFTLAPMDLSGLLDGQLPSALSEQLAWEIEDLTTAPPSRETTQDQRWTTILDVAGRRWDLTVTPTESSRFVSDASGPIVVLLAGLAASLLAATGAYLYRRRAETQQELDKLRDLGRAKDQFLASVSHELRTPLTGVLGFAELLRDNPARLSDAERKTMIANVADEANDLASIIDDLLVAARSELDLLAITRVPVSLRAQAAQVLEACDKNAGLIVEFVGDEDWRVLGDPSRVRQIIRNLITNADRYGGDSIRIRPAVETGDDMVGIEVADNGPGLPAEEWERIFEPYYRAHNDPTQPAALGIGLSVSRHLARLMGGDLSYRHEDGWSIFRLSLPTVAETGLAEEVQTHEPVRAASL